LFLLVLCLFFYPIIIIIIIIIIIVMLEGIWIYLQRFKGHNGVCSDVFLK
jgi:hypothetical protein